jgi:hypothetical protein
MMLRRLRGWLRMRRIAEGGSRARAGAEKEEEQEEDE